MDDSTPPQALPPLTPPGAMPDPARSASAQGGHAFASPRFGASAPGRRTAPARRGRPWLWVVAGVVALAVAISGSVFTGETVVRAIAHADAGAGTSPSDAAADVASRLTRAMNANDRAAFIRVGEGATVAHLAALWDETKKVGWTLGVAESSHPTGSVQLAFNMELGGFRAVTGALVHSSEGDLLATFLYAATIRGTGSASKLVALDALYPMPWDRGERIAVVQGSHVTLFADADESALAAARLPEAESAAADVLARPEWTGSRGRLDGFVAYVTQDSRDFTAAYGPGGADGTAGFCRTDIRPSEASAEVAKGVATGDDLPGGALAVIGPGGLVDDSGYVFAHEFAHYLQNVYDPAPYDRSGADTGHIAFSEGYAESVAAQHTGEAAALFTTGEVRQTVLDGDLASVLAPASFSDDKLSEKAYLTAGSYFYFLDQHHADYRRLLGADSTGTFAEQITETMRPGAQIEDWRAWVAAQPGG